MTRCTGINSINEDIKRKRWKWLGHTLIRQKTRYTHVALKLNPEMESMRQEK
uniref:Uncharacterized protein n=1 Tax=Arion vulgaris TaxID=1028688 RepID=A0A0B7BEQ0_9EUPU